MRRSTRRSSYRRPAYRKKAVPVPKVKRTVRKYTRSNSMAINKLSRQVHKLQQSQFGSVQSNFQTSNLMIPFASRPILTDIGDLTCRRATSAGALFAQYSDDPTPVLSTVGNWTPSTNLFFQDMNADIVDTGKYLMLSCHVTLKFTAVPSVTDCRCRVDLFSVKANAIPISPIGQPIYSLPTALQELTNLASPELNKLGGNPFLKVWATKWVYLSSSRNMTTTPASGQLPGPAVTGNSKYVSFNIRPKNGKLRNQSITVPYSPGDLSTVQDGDYGPFNIAQDEALFMCISVSDNSATGPGPNNVVTVQCSRSLRWRDHIGKASF